MYNCIWQTLTLMIEYIYERHSIVATVYITVVTDLNTQVVIELSRFD